MIFDAYQNMSVGDILGWTKSVVNVTGDLHGGCFHFLQVTYTLIFGSLVQPVQALLGWKHTKISDVTTCYQQAAGLTIIMDDEMEIHLLASYLLTVAASETLFNALKNNEDTEVAAIAIASGYLDWMKEKRRMGTHDYFVMSVNFVHLIKMYHIFRLLIRNGDAVTIERL